MNLYEFPEVRGGQEMVRGGLKNQMCFSLFDLLIFFVRLVKTLRKASVAIWIPSELPRRPLDEGDPPGLRWGKWHGGRPMFYPNIPPMFATVVYNAATVVNNAATVVYNAATVVYNAA